MTKQFTYKCYKKNFQSIPEVMAHMTELQNELQETNLSNLSPFNITYFIITKNVFEETTANYFSDETTMKHLDINFAKYYFDALKKYSDGQDTTLAWEVLFDFCKQNTSMPLIYLALGVNAHVNNDLGLSLFDTVKSQSFKKDFDKVNKIIYDSLDEVCSEIGLPKFYKPFMNILIKRWRDKAWNNYVDLKDETKDRSSIEMTAIGLAKTFAKINSPKDFYHLRELL